MSPSAAGGTELLVACFHLSQASSTSEWTWSTGRQLGKVREREEKGGEGEGGSVLVSLRPT